MTAKIKPAENLESAFRSIKEVDLWVTYDSLQGSTIPSYKREDLSNAVTVLALGFDGNSDWGPALATLVGAISDAIKSFGMEHHVCRGLNITSNFNHCPSERLIRINKNWSRISKSIRSEKYDYVLSYKNEKGEEINEGVTRFSAGLIFAVINFKDGSKREKNTRKLEVKDHGKRKRDGNEEEEGGGSEKRKEGGGRKTNKKRKGNFPRTRNNYGPVAEDESETPNSPKPFRVRMTPHNVHYSSSSSDSSYFSDSNSKAIAEEFCPEDTTKTLEFQPDTAPEEDKDRFALESVLVQVAKSSLTDLISRPNAASVLVLDASLFHLCFCFFIE